MNLWRAGMLIGAVVVVAAGCSVTDRKVSGSPTTATGAASPTTSTSAVVKPIDDAGLPRLLGSPSEISDVVGVAMTPEAIFRKPDTKLRVEPVRCLEAVMPGLDTVSYFGRTGFAGQGLHGDQHARAVQVLASFPTDSDAVAFRDITVGRWRTCQNRQATVTDRTNIVTYQMGRVNSVDSVATVSMSGSAGDGVSVTCQHALGARRNVILDVRVCTPEVGDKGRDLLLRMAAKLN